MATENNLWLLGQLISKCDSSLITLVHAMLFSCLVINILFWAHPGGPAWGRVFFLKKSTRPPPPGPRGFPIIGSMTLLSGGLAHHKLAAAACHSKRLMAFSLGYTRAITTCTADVAKDILNSSAFTDRPPNESAYGLMFNRSMGFAPYGVYWSTLRKIASAHLFCTKQLKASEHRRLHIANHLVQALLTRDDQVIRVRDFLKPAALNNMMSSVFGRTYSSSSSSSELQELIEQGYALLGELNWSDHLPNFLSELDLQRIKFRCSRIVPRVKRFVGEIIADHRDSQDHEDRTSQDFVDVLMSLQAPDILLSDSDMISVLWEMIFRGTDTVAVLMEWVLARLVMHPEVQCRVHEEVEKVVDGAQVIKESDVNEMVYLKAVVKEVLRLHPPGPLMSWSRMSIRDSIVDGHHVPAGTTAMVNMWAIMRDPQLWDQPLTFNPDRWFHNDAAAAMSAPFGLGRRSCPGKTMGTTTVELWLATLVRHFQFHSCTTGVDLTELLRLSCEMANPLMVRVQPRPLQ